MRTMRRTFVDETECRDIGAVEVLEEEGLSMESVDGKVLAAGEPEWVASEIGAERADPLTCTSGSFFGQTSSSVSWSSFHCESRPVRMARCADDLRTVWPAISVDGENLKAC
jgi:hypothetical protein